jgi:hypothetical protein
VINTTGDLALITDGERRYGQVLFDRKRPNYQAPCREHPQTSSAIENAQIHANHLEAFNASLRRRCAAYRRKTNTYAKKEKTPPATP